MTTDSRFLHENLANDLSNVVDKSIMICGCGAIGSNLAECLARMGFRRFHLIDKDRVEPHNISTQVWFDQDIGKTKARTLSFRLYQVSKAIAIPHEKDIKSRDDIRKISSLVDLVIDCFDNRAARECAVRSHENVLHVGLSIEDTAEVTWDEKYALPIDIEIDDPCAYPMSRMLILQTVSCAASSVVEFFLKRNKREWFVSGGGPF